jgi:glucose-1-phosphate cytidylyltransferase
VKIVLLAGGLGTRLREETEFKPKPMVEVGSRPILWHIMKTFEASGYRDFIVCAGYRSEVIKNYFSNLINLTSDFSIEFGVDPKIYFKDLDIPNWNVTISDTGLETMTGGRIKKIEKYVDGKTFFCTYGDGLANVDIEQVLAFHKSHGKIATVTAVHPTSRFGQLTVESGGKVSEFSEKPLTDEWINGGYFVFEPDIFDYLSVNSILEKETLPKLAKDDQLRAFKHEGYWQPMDTYREFTILNELWNSGNAPWKVW